MKRMSLICCTLATLLMTLGAVQTASAGVGLKAFSPNPAVLNGVVTGGMPAWYQDQSGVAVDACFDIVNCGLVGFLPNNNLPLSFPTNFPEEAFYFLAQADISMTGGASAIIIMALEYTFVNPVSGALTGPVATPNALSAPFQRIRIIESLVGGAGDPGFPAGGSFTLTTPWGPMTIAAADAKCVNQGGNTKCTFTQDIPNPGLPVNFAAALVNGGVPGSIDTFIRATSPVPPVGFLGNGGAALTAVTTAGAPAVVTLLDPLGNTGTNGPGGSFSTLVGKTIGMEVQPGNNINLGATNMITPAAVPQKVTVTNTTGFAVTFPLLVTAGADPADFVITSPSATVVAGEVGCSGNAVAPSAICSFDISFRPATLAKAARSANILLAPTALLPANNPPPVTLILSGSAEVNVTANAVGHGTITPTTTLAPAGTALALTVTPANKKFKVKEVADVAGGAASIATPSATDPTSFTINTGAANHTVTATFMPSGDLDANGTLGVADAQKALKIVTGILKADVDDPDNTAVKVAPLVGGKPAPDATRVAPNIGDVLVILRRVVGLETW